MGAPVSHTCPTIDSVIEDIKRTRNEIEDITLNGEDMSLNDIKRILREAVNRLDSLYGSPRSDMEEIRTANEKLREWGFDNEEKVAELESEIQDLNYQLKNAA